MTDTPVLIDTNVLVYAFDNTEKSKNAAAKRIILSMINSNQKMAVSTQVLNEFCHVASSKIGEPLSIDTIKPVISNMLKSSASRLTGIRFYAPLT